MKTLLTLLLASVLVGAATLYLRLNALVQDAVERYGSQAAGVKVRVRSVSLSPFSGSGRLSGLAVENPPGYSKADALSVDDIRVSLDPKSLWRSVLVVREVRVSSPAVLWEMRLGESNLGRIRKNLEGAGGRPAKKDAAPGKRVVIKDFAVTGGRLTVASAIIGKAGADLPELRLKNLGERSGGATAQEIAAQALDAILKSAIEAGGSAQSAGKGLLDTLGGLFGRKKK